MLLLKDESTGETIAHFRITGLDMQAKIKTWIENNLELIKLNERYNCEVLETKDGFVLSSDDDWKILELINLDTIAITL